MLRASRMCRLSVNVNKLATLRNSRGKNRPDVAQFSAKILALGSPGLTIHPRPDGRHIRKSDVEQLFHLVKNWNSSARKPVEFNIEGYPSADFLKMLEIYPPDQATLVPDPPEALTSNAGWALQKNKLFLRDVLAQLKTLNIRSSVFVDPFRMDGAELEALADLKPDRIELYTELYADAFGTTEQSAVTSRYVFVATEARKMGIGVNAGHDLSQENLGHLIENIPWLDEVSIGHALICEALEQGLATTIGHYLQILSSHAHADSHAPRT